MNREDRTGEADLPNQPRSGESQTSLRPQIWIGSLADYNNGDLHGDWLDAARPVSEIYADVQQILAHGPAARRGEVVEEWGIFDHDEFGGLQVGEYESIEEVSRLADAVVACGEPFALWAEAIGASEATVDRFRESYRGTFESAAAYAEQLVGDTHSDSALKPVGDWLQPYIHVDYEALARDLQLSSEILCVTDRFGAVHVFDGG